MKLLHCLECHDIVKLHYDITFCKCSKSWGQYERDGLYATFGGPVLCLGISNLSFLKAVKDNGNTEFIAFTIKDAKTVKYK